MVSAGLHALMCRGAGTNQQVPSGNRVVSVLIDSGFLTCCNTVFFFTRHLLRLHPEIFTVRRNRLKWGT